MDKATRRNSLNTNNPTGNATRAGDTPPPNTTNQTQATTTTVATANINPNVPPTAKRKKTESSFVGYGSFTGATGSRATPSSNSLYPTTGQGYNSMSLSSMRSRTQQGNYKPKSERAPGNISLGSASNTMQHNLSITDDIAGNPFSSANANTNSSSSSSSFSSATTQSRLNPIFDNNDDDDASVYLDAEEHSQGAGTLNVIIPNPFDDVSNNNNSNNNNNNSFSSSNSSSSSATSSSRSMNMPPQRDLRSLIASRAAATAVVQENNKIVMDRLQSISGPTWTEIIDRIIAQGKLAMVRGQNADVLIPQLIQQEANLYGVPPAEFIRAAPLSTLERDAFLKMISQTNSHSATHEEPNSILFGLMRRLCGLSEHIPAQTSRSAMKAPQQLTGSARKTMQKWQALPQDPSAQGKWILLNPEARTPEQIAEQERTPLGAAFFTQPPAAQGTTRTQQTRLIGVFVSTSETDMNELESRVRASIANTNELDSRTRAHIDRFTANNNNQSDDIFLGIINGAHQINHRSQPAGTPLPVAVSVAHESMQLVGVNNTHSRQTRPTNANAQGSEVTNPLNQGANALSNAMNQTGPSRNNNNAPRATSSFNFNDFTSALENTATQLNQLHQNRTQEERDLDSHVEQVTEELDRDSRMQTIGSNIDQMLQGTLSLDAGLQSIFTNTSAIAQDPHHQRNFVSLAEETRNIAQDRTIDNSNNNNAHTPPSGGSGSLNSSGASSSATTQPNTNSVRDINSLSYQEWEEIIRGITDAGISAYNRGDDADALVPTLIQEEADKFGTTAINFITVAPARLFKNEYHRAQHLEMIQQAGLNIESREAPNKISLRIVRISYNIPNDDDRRRIHEFNLRAASSSAQRTQPSQASSSNSSNGNPLQNMFSGLSNAFSSTTASEEVPPQASSSSSSSSASSSSTNPLHDMFTNITAALSSSNVLPEEEVQPQEQRFFARMASRAASVATGGLTDVYKTTKRFKELVELTMKVIPLANKVLNNRTHLENIKKLVNRAVTLIEAEANRERLDRGIDQIDQTIQNADNKRTFKSLWTQGNALLATEPNQLSLAKLKLQSAEILAHRDISQPAHNLTTHATGLLEREDTQFHIGVLRTQGLRLLGDSEEQPETRTIGSHVRSLNAIEHNEQSGLSLVIEGISLLDIMVQNSDIQRMIGTLAEQAYSELLTAENTNTLGTMWNQAKAQKNTAFNQARIGAFEVELDTFMNSEKTKSDKASLKAELQSISVNDNDFRALVENGTKALAAAKVIYDDPATGRAFRTILESRTIVPKALSVARGVVGADTEVGQGLTTVIDTIADAQSSNDQASTTGGRVLRAAAGFAGTDLQDRSLTTQATNFVSGLFGGNTSSAQQSSTTHPQPATSSGVSSLIGGFLSGTQQPSTSQPAQPPVVAQGISLASSALQGLQTQLQPPRAQQQQQPASRVVNATDLQPNSMNTAINESSIGLLINRFNQLQAPSGQPVPEIVSVAFGEAPQPLETRLANLVAGHPVTASVSTQPQTQPAANPVPPAAQRQESALGFGGWFSNLNPFNRNNNNNNNSDS